MAALAKLRQRFHQRHVPAGDGLHQLDESLERHIHRQCGEVRAQVIGKRVLRRDRGGRDGDGLPPFAVIKVTKLRDELGSPATDVDEPVA